MIKIGRIHVCLELREIFLDNEPLRLGTRAFDILEMLIRAKGGLVRKEDILRCVWPNTIVEENNLQVHISSLRKMLGDDKDLIRTTPGRGYRLVLPRDATQAATGPAQPAVTSGMTAGTTAGVAVCLADMMRAQPIGLPLFHGPLIGRETAVEEVLAALQRSPLVTLVGAGGIGKTQLGIEVARLQSLNSAAAVCFVALGSNDGPAHVVRAVANALRIEMFGTEPSLGDVTAAVAGRELLLVLDNCEHVINEAATLCEHLVRANKGVRILATSREPVRTACEQLYWVPPLEMPVEGDGFEAIAQRGAVQMFIARARAFDPHFTYDSDSIAQIATVCRRLDGVPLALELAAARAATLGISELVSELEDRFRVLTGGLRSAPLRQQTLKATLDWSYRFLSREERMVLRRVSVFDGHFPLEVACRIVGSDDLSEGEVTEAIAGLASKSLLMFDSQGPRKLYYLLESTRVYAMQDLDDPDERANVGARHEEYGVPWTFSGDVNGATHFTQ